MKRYAPIHDFDDNDFEETNKSKKKKHLLRETGKFILARQAKVCKDDQLSLPVPPEPDNEGHSYSGKQADKTSRCPVCYLPFRHLIGVTENWHVSECLDKETNSDREVCIKGLQCDAFSAKHYLQFKHFQDKSNLELPGGDTFNVKTASKERCEQSPFNLSSSKSKSSVHTTTPVKPAGKEPLPHRAISWGRKESSTVEKHVSKEPFHTLEATVVDGTLSKRCSEVVCKERGINTNVSNCKASIHCSANCSAPVLNVSTRVADEVVEVLSPRNSFSNETKLSNMVQRKLKQTNIGVFFGSKKVSSEDVGVRKEVCDIQDLKTVTPAQWRWGSSKSGKSHAKKVHNTPDEVDIARDKNKQGRQARSCPFYKRIPDSPFTVDAFRYGEISGCLCYFLTHFHYDHYGGLTRNFKGTVYCSKVTGNLVISQLRVPRDKVVALPMNQPTAIHNIIVTLLDANHCPGSVLFLFEWPNGKTALHTGDFRADQSMANYPSLQQKCIDVIYLDTTYCLPYYKFPTQQNTIEFAVRKVLEYTRRESRTLIVCGTYTIGKERVFHAIAEALDSAVFVRKEKMKVLSCLEWDELERRLTVDQNAAQVHVLPMNCITIKYLQDYLDMNPKRKQILAFKPTGWTYTDKNVSLDEVKPITRPGITIYGIPYSEHSSFTELEWFVRWLKPKRIIPTVNVGSQEKRAEMERSFKEWLT